MAIRVPGGLYSTKDAQIVMFGISFFLVFSAIYLAGSGVRTQSSFQMVKGLHGSTYFTLSLPVSRFHLLAMRAGLGLLEMAGINAIVIATAWISFPLVRAGSTPSELLQTIIGTTICTASFHFLSVFSATFLGEVWQVWGSLRGIGCLWWILARLHVPASMNVFGFLGSASPLITHRLPWPAMGISLLASAILFFAALRIVETREY